MLNRSSCPLLVMILRCFELWNMLNEHTTSIYACIYNNARRTCNNALSHNTITESERIYIFPERCAPHSPSALAQLEQKRILYASERQNRRLAGVIMAANQTMRP